MTYEGGRVMTYEGGRVMTYEGGHLALLGWLEDEAKQLLASPQADRLRRG